MTRSNRPAREQGVVPGLADAVARLSRLMTRDRDRMPQDYLRDPQFRMAYLQYFLPANLPKIGIPLGELALHPAGLLNRERLRLLDVGSGPGTSLLGTMDFFGSQVNRPTLDITAVDHVSENLREAEKLFRKQRSSYAAGASLRTIQCDVLEVERRIEGEFDIIVLSNVLNELFPGDGDRCAKRGIFAAKLIDRLMAPDGAVIIIEPALRETSRDLLVIRDHLVAGGSTVFSPCIRQGSCPALEREKDWCHEDRPWVPPDFIRTVDRLTGLRKDSLKFSYLVLRRDGHSLAEYAGSGGWRIVSEPLRSKGKIEFYLCGREGRFLAARLDKDTAPPNEEFGILQRGDVVRLEGAVRTSQRIKIGRDTQVLALVAHRSAKETHEK